MNVTLLRKYRRIACKKFYLIKQIAAYPRCRYRWLHDKKELEPLYVLCDNGEMMWNERTQSYQSSTDINEAKDMLRRQIRRYIEYLYLHERAKRGAIIKTIQL